MTSVEQLDILGGGKPIGRTAPRQDAALELLRSHPEGCSADEIGAAIHASSGKHAADEICQWCGPDSRDVIRALERKQLIRRTGNGQFVLRIEQQPDTSFGAFPEGF